MNSHRWTEIDGASYCATCGAQKSGAPLSCRDVTTETIPSPISAPPSAPQEIDLSRFLALRPISDEVKARYAFQEDIIPRMREAGFGERHCIDIVDWKCEPQRRVYEAVSDICKGVGAIVVLTGNRGTGKTTICAQICRARAQNESLAPHDRQPPYRKLIDLIAKYKPLYSRVGSVEMDTLASSRDWFCTRPRLKFIDEIHECEDLELKNRVLTDMLDRSYAAKVDVILASNQATDDFIASVSDSVNSRISEHGKIIACTWESWRSKNNQ